MKSDAFFKEWMVSDTQQFGSFMHIVIGSQNDVGSLRLHIQSKMPNVNVLGNEPVIIVGNFALKGCRQLHEWMNVIFWPSWLALVVKYKPDSFLHEGKMSNLESFQSVGPQKMSPWKLGNQETWLNFGSIKTRWNPPKWPKKGKGQVLVWISFWRMSICLLGDLF